MLDENLLDAAEIIQHILNQPLVIPGSTKRVSLLEAAKTYDSNHPLSSDLRKIVMSFLQFPGPTKKMVREMQLLQKDLR